MLHLERITDERILAALLTAGSVRAAAKSASVSEGTIRNRLSDPDFRAKYDALRGDLLQEATAGMTAHLQAATETMTAIMEDTENAASVRLAACDALLRHCLRYFSATEIERRIAALEAAQGEGEA